MIKELAETDDERRMANLQVKMSKRSDSAVRRMAALENGMPVRAGSLSGVFAKPGKTKKAAAVKSTR